MNSIRSYFRETKHELYKTNLLSYSAKHRAKHRIGLSRQEELNRDQLLGLQVLELVTELRRIWNHRHSVTRSGV